jgi:phenylalanyl-tRNA synthetase beta chain
VDITNYVLLELGQPMHAFDLTKIGGGEIRVRRARAGEKITTLDGQDRTLTPDMLVIADNSVPMAIAGVMGGADSEVGQATRTIVFESASFNANSVRRTSKALGLKTEASTRFERGVDPNLPLLAMRRACALLAATGAGRPRGTVVDAYPAPIVPRQLALRRTRLSGLLGVAISDAEVTTILTALGFGLAPAADGWTATVPTRRVDVLREVDLIEEVARHYGFDRIPATFPPLRAAAAAMDPRITRARHLRRVLTGAGFFEAVTFGFIGEAVAAPFAAPGDLAPIANPLSENFAVLRPSALPGLLDALAHNRRREQRDVRLFELGNVFSKTRGERQFLALAWTGGSDVPHWSGAASDVTFFDMKGALDRVCRALSLQAVSAPHTEGWLVAGQAAALLSGAQRIGVFGRLSKALAERHGLPGDDAVFVADVDLDAAGSLADGHDTRVTPLPRYPSVTRDIALLVSDTLPAADLRATIRRAAPASLADVREFDRYQGKGVSEGKVSLALRLTFRAADRTLTDAEVQSAMDAIVKTLAAEHHAIQR